MAFDVFISHSSKDKQAADATCAALEAAAIRCWIAPRDVRAGHEYAGEIIDAIDSCRVMVLIFSSNANASNQVRREIERAVSKGVTIVPMRIEDVLPSKSMEFYLDSIHWLDALTPPLANHLQHLVEQVAANLRVDPAGDAERAGKLPTKLQTRKSPFPRSNIWPIIGGLIVLVLLVAGTITMVQNPRLNIFSKTPAPNTPTQQLLLNVLRASFNEPLEFTWNAPYAAMQKPISLGKLNHAIRDGYTRELLFWLFADSFELQTIDHLLRYHYAPPDDYGCAPSDRVHRCFVDWVRTAALTGLTAQEKTSQTSDANERLCFSEGLAQEAFTAAKAAVSGEVSIGGPSTNRSKSSTIIPPIDGELWRPERKWFWLLERDARLIGVGPESARIGNPLQSHYFSAFGIWSVRVPRHSHEDATGACGAVRIRFYPAQSIIRDSTAGPADRA
jgi:hypothetical protein